MNLCLIYKLANKVNDKVYIGQTWNSLKKRGDFGRGCKGCLHMINAIII